MRDWNHVEKKLKKNCTERLLFSLQQHMKGNTSHCKQFKQSSSTKSTLLNLPVKTSLCDWIKESLPCSQVQIEEKERKQTKTATWATTTCHCGRLVNKPVREIIESTASRHIFFVLLKGNPLPRCGHLSRSLN